MSIQRAIDFVASSMGYHVHNSGYLEEALDASGYFSMVRGTNKCLANIGDGVLALVIRTDYYLAGLSTGEATQAVERLASNPSLAETARRIGLYDHVVVNAGQFGRPSDKTLVTTLEAVFGAIYLDCGKSVEPVRSAMLAIGMTLSGDS